MNWWLEGARGKKVCNALYYRPHSHFVQLVFGLDCYTEWTCTVYVALVWNITYWIMMMMNDDDDDDDDDDD